MPVFAVERRRWLTGGCLFSSNLNVGRYWQDFRADETEIPPNPTQIRYTYKRATFVELPPFQRLRAEYFDDDSFRDLQNELMKDPEAGDMIKGTGGLRKIRYADKQRGKGKRGGLRVIYFWKDAGGQFWLFTVYDKDEANDLTPDQCRMLKQRLDLEIMARRT